MILNNLLFSINIPVNEEEEEIPLQHFIQSKCWVCRTSRSTSVANDYDDLDFTVSIFHQQSSDHHHFCHNQRPLEYVPLRIFSGPMGSESMVMEIPFQLQRALLQGFLFQIDRNIVKCMDRYRFQVIIGAQSLCQTSPRCSKYPEQAIASTLSQSQIPLGSEHLLKELLEQSRNGDIQLSFCSSTISSGQSTDFAIPAHSCVLRTVGTIPMEKILNTSSITGSRSTMLPVREICFKDSSPAAVEAVIRYIYLGQKPILEPLCGYTVKDLMSLASYLEIECLQDYCVDLVLGKNYSTNRVTFNSHSITADGSRSQPRIDLAKSLVEYENHKVFQRGAHQRQNQVGAEIILQVLFTWGHRFAKIRHGIIQALINDYGYEFRGGNMVALERFKDHEGFDDILCEMMEMMRQIK